MRTEHDHKPTRQSSTRRLLALLATPVDGASLAAFRIVFGLVIVWHVARYVWPQHGTTMAEYLYGVTQWNFSYPGFRWVQPWPEPWLTAHFLLVGLAGLCVALGLCYRTSAATLFVSLTYTFLWDQAKYNNHYYLMCLIAFLLIWMPLQKRFSIDAWILRCRASGGRDVVTTGQVEFWPILLLRSQLFVMYFYAGVAKINSDWLSGIPLRAPGGRFHAVLAEMSLGGMITVEQLGLLLAWVGLAFDLSIGFLLLAPRTRWLAVVLLACFHATNHFMFDIGVFPVLAFATSLIFFSPDWPLRFARWIKHPRLTRPEWGSFASGVPALPRVGAALGWRTAATETSTSKEPRSPGKLVVGFIMVWMAVQMLVPLRHYAISGDANWTEEGQRFAWRMKLRAKAAGYLAFRLHDSGLQQVDSSGKSHFAWQRWPGSHAIYVPIESSLFRWDHHFGLNTTQEPCLGQRVIFVPFGNSDEALEAKRSELVTTWRTKFGREIEVHETISLDDALEDLRGKLEALLQESTADDATVRQACLGYVDAAIDLASRGDEEPEYQRENRWVAIVDRLNLLADSSLADVAMPILRRIHPFALQGAEFPEHRFLVVDDSQVTHEQRDLAMRRLGKGNPYLVWVDLSRLRPEDWRKLPRTIVTFDNRDLKIVWNYFHDLNHIQVERFSVRPDMIRQYARHIAETWKSETGRRPQVFALGSVMLNYRHSQPLVDPAADLARVEYTCWSHNAWILPDAAAADERTWR